MTSARTILLTTAALLAGTAAADWAVPEAPLRFDFTVESSPSTPAAGILVFLPDGGLLPVPEPNPTVLDGAGKAVDFDILWRNPKEGLGLVIAKPATPGFSVYVGRQSRLSHNDRVSFTPGPLFYVKQGNASLESATKLAGGFPPGRDSVMGPVQLIGQQGNPFGSDLDFSGWFTAWLKVEKPGRYYVATISDEGSVVKINDRTAAEWPGLHTRQAGAKGQFGSFVELTAGAHSVEYFYFNAGGPSEAQLAWRPPGGSAGLPTLVPASAYHHSGSSRLTGVADRDGGPVAIPFAACDSYFWFGELPANLFLLSPRLAGGNPTNTIYEWRMDDGKLCHEPAFPWIFEGSEPRTITLTARSGNRVSSSTCTIRLATTPPAASLYNPTQRTQYRTALLTRCRAVPPPGRPAADWTSGLWDVVINVVEPFKGQGLLTELFERSREDLVERLSPADRGFLEDVFAENLRYSDPVKAAAWLDRFEREEKNLDRKREWTLGKIELALYQAGDTNLARKIAANLSSQAPGTEAGVLALVRLGDIEALAGNFDGARAFYAQAQAKTPRKTVAPASGEPAAAGTSGKGLARNKNEIEKARAEEDDKRKGASSKAGSGFSRRVDPWKAEAVRGGAYYETIRDLLRDGYLREARMELRNWEIELPTEKLGGEFPVAEAEYFMAIHDYSRARTILATCLKAVDVSPYIPRAMGMQLDCLQKLGHRDEALALAALALKRFPGTPVAGQARRIQEFSAAPPVVAPPTVEAP
jgi:TolA-binding protein